MRLLVPAVAAAAALVLAGCSEPEPGSPLPTGGAAATSAAPSEVTTEAPSTEAPSTEAPEPTAGETETPTAEPSAVPTEAPTLPPEATTNDAAGAEAFVRYWYSTLNFAYATGDSAPLRDASADECEACLGLADVIDAAYVDSGRIEGGEVELDQVVAPQPDSTGAVLLSVVFSQAAATFVNGSGEALDDQSASDEVSQSAIIQRSASEPGWLMYGLAR